MKYLAHWLRYGTYCGLLLLMGCFSRQQGLVSPLLTPPRVQVEGNHYQVDFSQNSVALLKSHFNAYPGDEVVICQKENQFDVDDPDFSGKILPSSQVTETVTDHATLVASIMTGLGNSSPANEGIAPKARLISTSFNSLSPEADGFLLSNKIGLVNHSYGTAISYQYSKDAAEYDAQIRRLPYLMHIFSSGNSGLESAPDGRYKGIADFANLTGHYKMAKNAMLVGAVDSKGVVLPNSSRGPAYDGRIKPELVAYSPDGTSFSSALVSGVTAVLQDIYQKYFKQKAPASLLKALLINSADDVGTPGPDFSTGYGALNGYASALALTNKLFREGTVRDGEQITFDLVIPANVRRMKVTLAWTDPVGTPQSLTSAALVNDLDLDVVRGKIGWQPWVLSTAPHPDSLRMPAQRGRDALNPVEQVTIDNPAAGLYTLRVKGTKVESGNQLFHVSYQFDLINTFLWLYPTASTTLQAGQDNTLRWQSTYAAEKGRLSYSTDLGKTWTLITSELPLKAGQFTWSSPNILTNCMLQIRENSVTYPIATCVLSPSTDVLTKRLCADSLLMAWQPVNSIARPVRYLVQQFDPQNNEWTNLAATTTLQALVKPKNDRVWLTVTPVDPSGLKGTRSTALSLIKQPVYCYYRDFDASSADNTTANLTLTLSQTEGVQEVLFEKMTPSGFQPFHSQQVDINNVNYLIDGIRLADGLNTYRVRIRLVSGVEVFTKTKDVFRFGQQDIVLYPNPLATSGELRIAIKEPDQYRLALYDALGQVVLSTPLLETNNRIILPNLPSGLYIAHISLIDKVVQTCRLVLR